MNSLTIADVSIRVDAKGALDVGRLGHVYVLESRCGGFVKIGFSAHPKKRLANLRTAANTQGRHWVSPMQSDAAFIESAAHQRLADRRCGTNEWFAVTFDEAVPAVSSLLGEPPTAESIKAARQSKRNKDEVACEQLARMLLSLQKEPEGEVGPCELAVAFVLGQERISAEVEFHRTEEDFLHDFDRDVTDLATADLVGPLLIQNAVLIGRGIAYDQRKPMLKQYAMDWRLERATTEKLEA